MQENSFINSYRYILGILLAEIIIIQVSGVSFHAITGNALFSLNVDPFTWLPFIAAIPKFILQRYPVALAFDLCMVTGIIFLILKPMRQLRGIVVFLLMFLFYVTLMSRHIHWNFQVGMFLILFPLCFRAYQAKLFAFEALRFFLLFFYASAGFLKIVYGAYLKSDHLSHLLVGQFGPYFIEGNTGWRTQLHLLLVNTPALSYGLFIGSMALELFAFTGFFTKKFDPFIAMALLLFHLANWVIMDIAPFGQIAFVCLLFFSKSIFNSDGHLTATLQQQVDLEHP